MKVREGIAKLVSATRPMEKRLALALGESTEWASLDAADRVTVLFLLGYDKDAGVSKAAKERFASMEEDTLLSALGAPLDPLVIRAVVRERGSSEAVSSLAVLNPGADKETVGRIAASGSEFIITILMDDFNRLRRDPWIIDALRKNPRAPVAALDSLKLMLDSVASGKMEMPEPQPEKSAVNGVDHRKKTEAISGVEEADDLNTYQKIQSLSVSEKIKLAFSGNKEERGLLVKESNKMISLAVLRNPRITDEEVMALTAQKSTPEELLRAIARNKEWIKNYSIKLGMVNNAKTPLKISLRLIESLNVKDIERVAKSRNVPGVLSTAARRLAEKKARR